MKRFVFLWSLLILMIGSMGFAQKYSDPDEEADKKWKQLVSVLKHEADFSNGKKGRIRFSSEYYTDFHIQDIQISESAIATKMNPTDRFTGDKESIKTEEIRGLGYEVRIRSANVLYGDPYYFDNFPEWLFLQIILDDEKLTKDTTEMEKETDAENWGDKTAREEKTNFFTIPIRTGNREKIFKAIEQFQSTLTKEELIREIEH